MKYSRGPWHACHDGKCPCKTIWNNDHPVAKIICGKWGDDFPNIRLIGPSLSPGVEVFMDQITYGEIDTKEAEMNARLIAEAPAMHEYIALQAKAGDCVAKQIIDDIKKGGGA